MDSRGTLKSRVCVCVCSLKCQIGTGLCSRGRGFFLASFKMADSALESAKIVTLSYQSKVKDNDINESSSTTNVKTPACGSLHPSSPSRIMDGVATGNVPLDNQAASTTKKTADSDKKKKSKMADEARSNSRAYEAIRLTSGGETREMSVNEHFDGQQRRSLITSALVNDEKKRRRSDRYDSSESSDRSVNLKDN